jgi:UDP-glucose 4-epimerase
MKTLAVTGIGSDLGTRFLKLVDEDPSIEKVIGIGVKEPDYASPKIEFLKHSDLTKSYDAVFADAGADIAVYLGLTDDLEANLFQRNVEAFQQFINAASVAACKTVTLLSSITGYGAHFDNPEVLYEGSLLRPSSEYGRAAAEIEKLCYQYVHKFPSALLQILRPAYIVGPDEQNALSRALRRQVLLIPSEAELAFQFVHAEDVARALHCLIDSQCVGIYNLAADSALTIEQIAQLAECRLVRCPELALKFFMKLGWLLGVKTPPWFEADAFDHSKHSILVANIKFCHEVYFDFLYTSPEAYLESLLAPLAENRDAMPTFAEELLEDDIETIDFLGEIRSDLEAKIEVNTSLEDDLEEYLEDDLEEKQQDTDSESTDDAQKSAAKPDESPADGALDQPIQIDREEQSSASKISAQTEQTAKPEPDKSATSYEQSTEKISKKTPSTVD